MNGIMTEIEQIFAELKHEYDCMVTCEKEMIKYTLDAKSADNADIREDSRRHATIKRQKRDEHRDHLASKAVKLSHGLTYLQEHLTEGR